MDTLYVNHSDREYVTTSTINTSARNYFEFSSRLTRSNYLTGSNQPSPSLTHILRHLIRSVPFRFGNNLTMWPYPSLVMFIVLGKVDLRELVLAKYRLDDVVLTDVDLDDVVLFKVDLHKVDLEEEVLAEVDLEEAPFKVCLGDAVLAKVDLDIL